MSGTTIQTLPAGGPVAAGASTAAFARASILLVDDQPARLLSYEAILSGLNVHCVRALSGHEALAKLLKQDFAAILLDVNMPGMDGFEVARLIRGHPRLERTPIIFITGVHMTEMDQLKGYDVGAIDYMAVPVVPEILRSKVAVLVELFQRRSELQELNRSLAEARAQLEAAHSRDIAQRQAQWHAIFEHPVELTIVLQAVRDSSGTITDWTYRNANRNTLRLLGVTHENLIGRRLSEIVPDASPRVSPLCSQVLNTGELTRYEARFRERDFLVTVFPMDEESVISSGVDITDRKRAEAALRESEARYRALIENAPVAVAHAALSGRLEYVNRAFCQLLGYAAEELLSKTWQDITHPDDVEADRAFTQRVLAGEIPHYTLEKRYLRKDGSAVWTSMFGNFVLDENGRAKQGLAVVIDITDRKRADREVRESRERLLLAKSAARIGIYDWDIRSGVIQWDERTRELWGVEPDERVTYDLFLSGVHPDDRHTTQEVVAQALDPAGEGRSSMVYRVINRKTGATRWVEAIGRAYFENGEAMRLIGTVQDVTERILAQQALKESDRRKDEFLAMLAHELRNPVAPIRNCAEVLFRALANDDKNRSLTEIIQRQSLHLSRLLDDLLDIARITQGRIELRREVVAVSVCIELAVEMVDPLVREKGHRLTVTQPHQPHYVYVDRVRFAQCVANILSNAAKYTPAGGEIRVRHYVEGGCAVVEIADNGIGISPEFQPRMFDLFAQSQRTLDRSQGGLGIGLSVCRQLVEMHDGKVEGTSAGLGHGSTFTIRMPLAERTGGSMEVTPAAADSAKRVLIVDDNQDAADSLAILLQIEGHETKTAYSAEDAIGQAAGYQPQIVLLDIGLPRMDGYEVASRIRTITPSARLIALSGYGRPEDKQRSAAAGFHAHLVKPIDAAAIKEAFAACAEPVGGRGRGIRR